MRIQIEELIHVYPTVWPNRTGQPQPGDLSQFAAMGFDRQPRSGDPVLDSPVTKATGGVLYWDGDAAWQDVEAALRLIDTWHNMKDYAVFIQHATDPQEQHYLTQLRIVHPHALRHVFNVIDDSRYQSFPQQPLNVWELIRTFIEWQQEAWKSVPEGVIGGDGDWEKERLGFGFMVEDSYHDIYRIWSRAWVLVK